MLNIGRLVATSFDYDLNKVARSQEEHDTGSGEAPGRWLGTQADRLGLAGIVPEEGCGGCSPASTPPPVPSWPTGLPRGPWPGST